MRAVRYDSFDGPIAVADVDEPVAPPHGVVVAVEATGLCRSDVRAWRGLEADVALPHVPGHELVGRVTAVGPDVARWRVGQRVTTPFVCACGSCRECERGQGQVCRNQTQPGFTHHGSFAERVALHHADANLVAVPDEVDAGAAALLGCRFATAHRGLALLAGLLPEESVLVLGCGGVGLSTVMLAVAMGADVVAVDVDPSALERARALGAATVDAAGLGSEDVAAAVLAGRRDGVEVSVDALGSEATLDAALLSLARRGRHVQIGLLPAEPVVRLSRVVSHELVLLGGHGMDARDYPSLMALVADGSLRPQDLVTRWTDLDGAPAAMAAMARGRAGVTMIRP